jgi:crossover junction endodeoxyribonuclease RuvC
MPLDPPLRILGVDPGLNVTGYGLLEESPRGLRIVEAGVIRSTRSKHLAERLQEIHQGLCEVLEQHRPCDLALEELYSHYDRPRTAIWMGHARGVICLAAVQHGIQVHHYAATRIKMLLTGNGRAPKSQVQTSIQRELNLTSLPEPADVADALAIALCHQFSLRSQGMTLGALTRPTCSRKQP